MGFSIIGIGGCGGNIADLWAKEGFHAGAINFSEKDLVSLENVKYKCKVLGSDGLGHNRDEAIQLLSENIDVPLNFIKENFVNQTNDLIMLAFATGGGSGSGLTPPLLDLCKNKFPNNTFIAMPILPSLSESVVSQLNTLNVFEELQNTEVCILPVDNEQIKNMVKSNGKHRIYDFGNQTIIKLLKNLQSFTEKHSQKGNFDTKDIFNLFSTHGFALIGETNITQVKDEEGLKINMDTVTKNIQHSWIDSIFVNPNMNKVHKSAFILNGQESLLDYVDYEWIYGVFDNGMPLDVFEGIYPDKNGYIMTVLTGMAMPQKRFNEIESIIEQKKEDINNIISDDQSNFKTKKSTTEIILSMKKPKREQVNRTKSITDILSKYKR